LRHVSDGALPRSGIARINGFAVNLERSAVNGVKAENYIDNSGFSTPRRANKAHRCAVRDGQADVFQRVSFGIWVLKRNIV
mgnify:CR=1